MSSYFKLDLKRKEEKWEKLTVEPLNLERQVRIPSIEYSIDKNVWRSLQNGQVFWLFPKSQLQLLMMENFLCVNAG